MINNLVNRLKAPVPLPDRIMEIVAGIMLIAMLVMAAILYGSSPEMVPSKFSFAGEPKEWSEKIFFWQISGLFVLFMAITYVSAYYTDRNAVRLPIRKREMNEYQKMMASRMCRIINIGLAILWCNILLSAASPALGISHAVLTIIMAAALTVILVPSLWYGIKIMRS